MQLTDNNSSRVTLLCCVCFTIRLTADLVVTYLGKTKLQFFKIFICCFIIQLISYYKVFTQAFCSSDSNVLPLLADLVFKIHVKGAFTVTKAAWHFFRKQQFGRIIFISSNSAIYGNFGQANYAAGSIINNEHRHVSKIVFIEISRAFI